MKKYFSSFKTILFTSMIFISAIKADSIQVAAQDFKVPTRLGAIDLFHDEDGFYVVKDNDIRRIENSLVDKPLRNISNDELGYLLGNTKDVVIAGEKVTLFKQAEDISSPSDFSSTSVIPMSEEEMITLMEELSISSYLMLNEMNDGSYVLRIAQRLKGGGIWGTWAGCWLGKFIVSGICHVAICAGGAVISCVATPFAGAAFIATCETTFGAAIETTSTAAAIAGGIALGVATGPV